MRIPVNNRLRGVRPVATGFAARIARYARRISRSRAKAESEGCVSRTSRLTLAAVPTAARRAAALALMSGFLLAACAPTIHVDAPELPALSPSQAASDCSTASNTEKIAPLGAPPQLPDAIQAPCPPGSGLAACFTLDQDLVRQKRFKILHDDRDYCRDAYDRARERAIEQPPAR